MNQAQTEFRFQKYVYHGTSSVYLESFAAKLLNSEKWLPNRDFGSALYTTISLEQAQIWALQTVQKMGFDDTIDMKPCVLKIAVDAARLRELSPRMLVFMGDSIEWARFIYRHRVNTDHSSDPCGTDHPDLIIGPMADNDTGAIVKMGQLSGKDDRWFYDQIIRDRNHRKLDTLQLGNQIAFCSEALSPCLHIAGYYLFEYGRWEYHATGRKGIRTTRLLRTRNR